MTPLFEIEPVTFRTPAPDSKKNRGRVVAWGKPCPVCRQRPHHGFRPSGVALAQEERLRDYLVGELWGDCPRFSDHDVRVVVGYHARGDICEVRVEDLGPRRKGFSGRKRDLANLLEVLLDAMQGPLYANDNQVAEIEMRRLLM